VAAAGPQALEDAAGELRNSSVPEDRGRPGNGAAPMSGLPTRVRCEPRDQPGGASERIWKGMLELLNGM
jgi:hypothetical protein